MSYKMIDKNLLVKPIFEEVSEGGIVLKQDFLPKTLRGEVLAVADHPHCCDVKVGDIVLFHKFAGKNFKSESDILRIIPIDDIEGVIVD